MRNFDLSFPEYFLAYLFINATIIFLLFNFFKNYFSFHPTFRSFRSFIAIVGIIACTIMLYGCKPLVGMIVSIIAILIYVIFPLHRKRFSRGIPYGIAVDIANMLLYSSTQKTNTGYVLY